MCIGVRRHVFVCLCLAQEVCALCVRMLVCEGVYRGVDIIVSPVAIPGFFTHNTCVLF